MDNKIQSTIAYPEALVKSLELIWGEGFLSPGGSSEVHEMLDGFNLAGQTVLDIGCGIGGVELVLVQAYKARRVVGVDLQEQLLDMAADRVAAIGLNETIVFQLVLPDKLPFENEIFDMVFTKDSLLHIADKRSYFSEIFRVIKPNGWFVASDGLKGTSETEKKRLRYQEALGLSAYWESLADYHQLLQQVGFIDIYLRDRSDWFRKTVIQDNERIFGSLKSTLIDLIGIENYDAWTKTRQTMRKAVEANELTTGHFRGRKPTKR